MGGAIAFIILVLSSFVSSGNDAQKKYLKFRTWSKIVTIL